MRRPGSTAVTLRAVLGLLAALTLGVFIGERLVTRQPEWEHCLDATERKAPDVRHRFEVVCAQLYLLEQVEALGEDPGAVLIDPIRRSEREL